MRLTLFCNETRESIPFSKPLFAVSHSAIGTIHFAASEIVETVPIPLRRHKPCKPHEEGFDVYLGTAPADRDGYSFSGLKRGTFLFSVSAEIAAHYLPETHKEVHKCRRWINN